MRRPLVLLTSASMLALPGCHLNVDERMTGTAIGMGAGALAGGLLGTAVGNTATGAILGGVAGGAAGYIIGDWMADERERGTAQARARDGEVERARAKTDATSGPAPATFDAIPASGDRAAAAPRGEMARRAYEAGRRATSAAAALGHYDAASSFDPTRPEPHNARGLVLLYQGETAAARAAFERALAVDPSYGPASENLGRLDTAP